MDLATKCKELAFLNFETRPDQPLRGDQQTAFMNSEHSGVTFLLGGNGCNAPEQEIYDPLLGQSKRIDSIEGPFHVWALDVTGNQVVAVADKPHACGIEDLYDVTLGNGRIVRVTLAHRIWTGSQWEKVGSLIGSEFVQSANFVRRDTYWDLHVPMHENYWMEGVFHHNSGTSTCGLVKAIRFMMKTEAPRKDTPYWIVAENYEQVCNVAWKEKMHLQGHLDPNCIDWERIQWYRPNMDWPYKVPLKPKPGGRHDRNFVICFKSYAQGRAAMQGESIAGFLMIEQFPWGILEEILRGCREYAYTGNKLAEFTPVDPSLSMELREMEENNKLPPDWAIYRCNTECAKEAGNITEQWFSQFFGMISGPMLDVRMKGLFGNFAGAVFPEFNPLIHCTPDDWELPVAWHHRRAIDFGFSIEHPLACVWSCHDGRGRTVIYDEYWSNDTSLSVIDHYKAISDKYYWPKNSYYGCTYVDHDLDAIRTLQKVNEYAEGYEAPTMHLAIKNVSEGIEHIKYLLKPTLQVEPGKYEPRLRILRRNCPHLMKEMISYRRPKQMTEGPNAQAVSQDPVKKDDDTVDAMRYVLFSEAKKFGITPSTLARQHSAGNVPIDSKKFNRRPPKRNQMKQSPQ